MSEIAEIRKIFQNLIAPAVKSVITDVSGLKNSVDKQFSSAEALAQARYDTVLAKLEAMDRRLETLSFRVDGRFETFEAVQSARHEAIIKALDIDKRLEKVEARQASQAVA